MKNGRKILLLATLIFGASILIFWKPIQHRALEFFILREDSPSPDTIENLIASSPHPAGTLERLWNSGKIPHRTVALSHLRKTGEVQRPLERILVNAAADPDMSMRELALPALVSREHPDLLAIARAQLTDADPQIRLLGLQILKKMDAQKAVPALIRSLDDPDPQMVATASVFLTSFTGHETALRIADSLPHNQAEGREKILKALESWKIWWNRNQSDYRLGTNDNSAAPRIAKLLVEDFQLPALNGPPLRLKALRGKIVWLNFWATWCPSCLSEIPILVELQKRFSDDLVVVGISLDGVEDSHGHVGGDDHHEGHDHAEDGRSDLDNMRKKVASVAERMGINYPVLLDTRNRVGARFNGGELPTNVLLDREGSLRRRFIGARSIEAFEAMIGELLEDKSARRELAR